MGHKCFVSYKKEDNKYKDELIELFEKKDIIDKTLDRVIDSNDADYIMQTIRENYLKDSTVTICLIGTHSSENEGVDEEGQLIDYYIIRELQASLYNGRNNTRNGVLGVVTPEMYSAIYKGEYKCDKCGKTHSYVSINDNTVIREFSINYYVEPHQGCCWSEDQRYCVLVRWDDFIKNPECYMEKAFEKRNESIADKVKVRAQRD